MIEGDGASVRLVPQPMPGVIVPAEAVAPRFGRGKGLYEMRDDFDEPIPGTYDVPVVW